jgi:hypothetical protein
VHVAVCSLGLRLSTKGCPNARRRGGGGGLLRADACGREDVEKQAHCACEFNAAKAKSPRDEFTDLLPPPPPPASAGVTGLARAPSLQIPRTRIRAPHWVARAPTRTASPADLRLYLGSRSEVKAGAEDNVALDLLDSGQKFLLKL